MGQDRRPPKKTPDLREKAEARLKTKAPDVQALSLDEIRALVSAVRLTDLKKSENSRNLLEWVSHNQLNRKEISDYGPL